MSIAITPFGKNNEGRQVDKITLTNAKGSSASFINYGAHIVSIIVPDKEGIFADVCLGYDSVEDYGRPRNGHIGSTVGRYANRIGGAKFELNGIEYHLPANDGKNCLHGGMDGFRRKLWSYDVKEASECDSVTMTYVSPDGEEGFPGTLTTTVTFTFDGNNRLGIRFEAVSDADTVINFTNHAYFNLAGEGDTLAHLLKIEADEITEVDEELIPTGWFAQIKETPYDLRSFKSHRDCLKERRNHPAFDRADGFDVNYVINGEGFRLAATVREPNSRREMTVETDQPGIQLYSGQGLKATGKGGAAYGPYAGIALETQHHPDSVNQPAFESTVLRKGETFCSETVYAFGVY